MNILKIKYMDIVMKGQLWCLGQTSFEGIGHNFHNLLYTRYPTPSIINIIKKRTSNQAFLGRGPKPLVQYATRLANPLPIAEFELLPCYLVQIVVSELLFYQPLPLGS